MTGRRTPTGRASRRGRWAAALTGIVALAVAAAGCSSSGGAKPSAGGASVEKPNLTVLYGTAGASMIPLWIAADEGLFTKHGLHVTLTLGNSTTGANAVISGSADLFMGEVTSAYQAEAQGVPMQIVATLLTKSINKFFISKKISTPAGLAGQSVAISAVGDTTDLAARLALAKLGVDSGKVTFLPTGGSSSRLAALAAGRVDGTVLSEPTATVATQQGFQMVLDQTSQPLADDGVTISKSFGEKNPNTVVAFLEAVVDGINYLRDPANKDTSLAVLAKYLNMKPTDGPVMQGYTTYQQILVHDPYPDQQAGQANLDGLKSEDPSRFGNLTLNQVFNPTFAQKLRDSGYLNQAGATASPSNG
jgi:NitT/TauT family transport system substrate-binding protein